MLRRRPEEKRSWEEMLRRRSPEHHDPGRHRKEEEEMCREEDSRNRAPDGPRTRGNEGASESVMQRVKADGWIPARKINELI